MKALVDAHRVVAVLAGDGVVRLRVPVGVVFLDLQRREALLGQLDDALDVVGRHQVGAGVGDRLAQVGVVLAVEAFVGVRPAVAGLEDGVEMPVEQLASR